MIKIITATLLTLLLTACGSEENGQDKKFDTTKHQDSTIPSNLEELKKKVTSTDTQPTDTKVDTKQKTSESFSKNIFELNTIDGKKIHIDEVENGILMQEYKGKVVFLLFFGYRCPPCLGEIPELIQLKKNKNLEIVAIEVQRLPIDQMEAFKKEKGINYTLLSGEDEENSKFISYIGQRARWGGSIPFLVVLSPKGEVKMVHVGGISLTDFQSIYENVLQEK